MRTLGVAFCLLILSATAALCASYDDFNAGVDAYNGNRWDDSIADFDRALAANDLVPSLQYTAHLDRALAHVAKLTDADLDLSLADLASCLALRPGDKTALDVLRLIHLGSGKLDAARQDMDAAIAGDPADDEAYINRGKIYELQGDAQKELQDFQTALNNNPANMGIYFLIGIADFQLGRYDDAVASITRALPVTDPKTRFVTQGVDDSTGWLWLDMIAIKQGKTDTHELPPLLSRYNWPYPIVDFFGGHSSEQAVLDTAKKGSVQQVCAAEFYLGEWHQLHGDAAGAKSLFQNVASKCTPSLNEWYVARAELKNVP